MQYFTTKNMTIAIASLTIIIAILKIYQQLKTN